MKSIIRWAIRNTPAMNTLLVSLIAVGVVSGLMLRREDFPRFELDLILVTVPYPGASPDEVENGVCEKIEEAVRSVDGIKKVTSVAAEGSANVILEVRSDVPDVQRVLNEVKSEVDRISSFPDLTEEPQIEQLTLRNPAISVGIVAIDNETDDADLPLRSVAERVRADLLLIPEISTADIEGERDYQIDVEISETTLRKYGLTLQDVARRIRLQNIELPGGKIKTPSQEYLLRGKNKRLHGAEIAKIPLVTKSNGVVLTVGDLGNVRDAFADTTSISRINGHPGIAISIKAAAREDMLAMTDAVRRYVATHPLPSGYQFEVWGDHSQDVRDRLNLLKTNGLQGLVLVFLTLALFLELRLSFWVALGIPVAVCGACAMLWQFDQTLNMLSMFAFLITLGIVVDDGIVIGENIYAHRERGAGFVQAAVEGTYEVLPSVFTSVATTVFAFVPMFFVTGVMGKFFAVLPMTVIAMLLVSLFEATFVLPCHLSHGRTPGASVPWTQRARRWRQERAAAVSRWTVAPILLLLAFVGDHLFYPVRRLGTAIEWGNRQFGRLLDVAIIRLYTPVLRSCLRHPAIVVSTAVTLLLLSVSLVRNGTVPWVIFPKLDTRLIQAKIVYPDGTPSEITDRATRRIEAAIQAVDERYRQRNEPVVRLTHRLVGQVVMESLGGRSQSTTGSHVGAVKVELVDNAKRSVTSERIVEEWRREAGEFAGVESLTFGSESMGPAGTPIEFKLLAGGEQMDDLESAVEECKAKLATYPGIFDIADDSNPGKWEIQLRVRDDAKSLGVPLEVLAAKVRAAYYGEEVMRLQRGRHEVKLMVRYPKAERQSLANLSELRVDAGDGFKRPLTEFARLDVARGYSELNRVNQKRSITVTADVDETRANAATIVADLRRHFLPGLFARYPELSVRWEGQQERTTESVQSLFFGLSIALLAMFVLLTLEFNSYVQPLIIMSVIPFGMIGALWGHVAMGLPLTLFSVLGLVALTGVVVNDAIVLVDFINARVRNGTPLLEALLASGQRRFRPVLLTSLTTLAGMLPILTERSFQAQVLIPMANSLCFGLLFSTVLVLFLVPTFYGIYARLTRPNRTDDSDRHDPKEHGNEPTRQHLSPSQVTKTGTIDDMIVYPITAYEVPELQE